MHQELRALYEEDQADRRGAFPTDLSKRDERRRRRVEQLLARGAVADPEDLFFAAMVFQHGADRSHFLRAHELAKRAAELGSTRPARWLAAAAYDRWLMTGGRPQKYGTHAGRSSTGDMGHQAAGFQPSSTPTPSPSASPSPGAWMARPRAQTGH